jgi:hypothetical protein
VVARFAFAVLLFLLLWPLCLFGLRLLVAFVASTRVRSRVVLGMTFDDALAPFSARTSADRLALVGAVLVLFGAWWGARASSDRVARAYFGACGALFVGGLAWRVLAIPFGLFVFALVLRAALRRAAGWRGSTVLAALGALVFLLSALSAGVARTERSAGGLADREPDPATETRGALERGNLFQARFWGERWAVERPDGDAAVVLAEINWALGHRARARAPAADVAARATEPALRRRADAHLSEWKEQR